MRFASHFMRQQTGYPAVEPERVPFTPADLPHLPDAGMWLRLHNGIPVNAALQTVNQWNRQSALQGAQFLYFIE